MQALKAQQLDGKQIAAKSTIALALVECLADPDPQLRDDLAYTLLAAWLESDREPPQTQRQMRERLYAMLDGPVGDGFAQPFAALVLTELARSDQRKPWMSAGERDAMLVRATSWLQSVSDYRGFDQKQGWRHGVAHGADWLGVLASDCALRGQQATAILDAVAAQAVPANGHAYVHGEPMRLVQPVIALAAAGKLPPERAAQWLQSLPARLGDAVLAYRDETWLARRHDLVDFLLALHLQTVVSKQKPVRALQPAVENTLRQLQ